MTRRILLVLLTFTAAVLVGAVVPLTLDAASHDRTSFIQATAGLARTDAAIAQSRLDALASSPLSSSADGSQGKADPALLVLIYQTWPSGPWSIPGPRSCAAWPRRSTPWPDAWRPWCTGTGP